MDFLKGIFGRTKESSPEDGNPALVQAMHEVSLNDNPRNRKKLYEAFLSSMLLIPVPELPKGSTLGMHILKADTPLPLISIPDANNVRITVAFTDIVALRNWDPNTPYLGLKAVDLFRLLLRTDIQDIVINPFDPIRKMIRPGGKLKRGEIELLAKETIPTNLGHQQFQIKKEEKVLVGIPANPPTQTVLDMLRRAASTFPAIAELYYFQMARGQGPSNTVIGIRLGQNISEDQRLGIVQALGNTIQPEMKLGQFLDFVFLTGSFGEDIFRMGKLFFPKS